MLKKVLKRVMAFSAATLLGFALLMVDPSSPSMVSEAQACEMDVYGSCRVSCDIACYFGNIPECNPYTSPSCNCEQFCAEACNAMAGGGCPT